MLDFIKHFKQECPNKTLWMYTGYIYEKDLKSGQRQFISNITNEILNLVDVLVDGPFMLELRDLSLKFRGSRNQRLLSKEDREKLCMN